MAHAGGRPSKLDEVTKEKLLAAIKKGHTLKGACAFAGVSYKTLHEWVQRGEGVNRRRARTDQFAEFADALKKADELAKVALVERWRSHFSDSWQAIATYMERRWPEEYGRRSRQTVDLREQMSYSDATLGEQLRSDPEARILVEKLFERRSIIMRVRKD